MVFGCVLTILLPAISRRLKCHSKEKGTIIEDLNRKFHPASNYYHNSSFPKMATVAQGKPNIRLEV